MQSFVLLLLRLRYLVQLLTAQSIHSIFLPMVVARMEQAWEVAVAEMLGVTEVEISK